MLWRHDDIWSDLDRVLGLMDYVRRRTEGGNGRAEGLDPEIGAGPRLVLSDEGPRLVLRAELPGFREDDVQVTLNEEVLTVRGERKVEVPEGYTAHRRERWPVRFSRTQALPCKVDPERTVARLRNGILTLEIPKTPESQPRTIKVQGS